MPNGGSGNQYNMKVKRENDLIARPVISFRTKIRANCFVKILTHSMKVRHMAVEWPQRSMKAFSFYLPVSCF